MAAAFLSHLSAGMVEVRSAGSAPADQVNPAAVQAMAEVGIDIAAEKPKILTDQAVRDSDVVITMGCGDTCPFYPGKRYEDWVLDDPTGKDVAPVRPIRDEIRRRVEALFDDLGSGGPELEIRSLGRGSKPRPGGSAECWAVQRVGEAINWASAFKVSGRSL
jgi:arsenate reductase